MSLDPLVVGCFYVQSKWIFQHVEFSIFLWITFRFFFQTGQTIVPTVHHMVSSNVDVKIFGMK